MKCRHCGNPVTWHEWPGPGGWVLRDYLGSICSDGLNHAVDPRTPLRVRRAETMQRQTKLPITEAELVEALENLRRNDPRILNWGEGECRCAQYEEHAGVCLGAYCYCH